jgi:competence protein ComEA
MFGRQPSPDDDAGSAARRRLAAITAQFAAADIGDGAGDQGRDDGPEPEPSEFAHSRRPDGPEPEPGEPARSRRPEGTARHRVTSGPRWGQRGLSLSPHHVAIVSLAVVAMIALTAWLVLRSLPHAQPVRLSNERTLPSPGAPSSASPPNAGAPAAPPSGGAPVSTATAASSVVVDVAGKVRRPGIVELPAGSRVVDALHAVGGARPGVQTRSLNLARPLVDGEQIVVGFDGPTPAGQAQGSGVGATATSASIAPVNLNSATAEQLDTLPGIGPVTAQAILTWRTENGPFTSVDELLEVSGIGDATLADIAPYVYV